jgi:hypothetical protein
VRTAKALDRLQRYAVRNGVDLDALDADSAVELMIGFFEAEPATDVDPKGGDESDALLFQWGVDDAGDDSTFVYDLTRRFCLDDGGALRVRQLSLTLHYKARKRTRAVGEGYAWAWGRAEVPELRKRIWTAPATALVRGRRPIRVELSFDGES